MEGPASPPEIPPLMVVRIHSSAGLLLITAITWLTACLQAHGQEVAPATDPAQIEFFEKQVRPLLVEHCHKCHGSGKQKGGLRLDSRASLLQGGDTGPAITSGQSDESELIRAIRYDPDGYQMPPTGKLPDIAIATLTRWVELGAPWPDAPHSDTPQVSEFNLKERAQRWSFQPLQDSPPPQVEHPQWCRTPIDRFLLAKLEEAGLTPASEVDKRTWLRRVTFDTIGLPPTPAEVQAFLEDTSPTAHERVIDRLLASPHFGERWGRHWLDLVRYAESRGHEFDFDVANAWQYRDYVIRAINDDVPYDQFVVEHVAGDLLKPAACFANEENITRLSHEYDALTVLRRHPLRLHPRTGANESIVATGFWYLGEWVHSPVDIRQEEADRFDNMIDVYSKAFLGLTVACARCHDHKFDPITQQDYYALQGYLQSSGYQQARFETMEHNRRIAEKLEALRSEASREVTRPFVELVAPVAEQIDDYLLAAYDVVQQQRGQPGAATGQVEVATLDETTWELIRSAADAHQVDAGLLSHWIAHLFRVASDDDDPLHLWARVCLGEWESPAQLRHYIANASSKYDVPDDDIPQLVAHIEGRSFPYQFLSDGIAFRAPATLYDFKLTDDPGAPIGSFDDTFSQELDPAFADLRTDDDTMSEPGALADWNRAGRVLRTPGLELTHRYLSARIRGGCNTYLAVDSHVLIKGPLHGSLAQEHPTPSEHPDRWRWITLDVSRYQGHRAHLEFSPRTGEPFAVGEVIWSDERPRGATAPAWLSPFLASGLPTALTIPEVAALISQQLANVTAAEWLYYEGGIGGGLPSSSEAEWARRHPQLFGLDTERARALFTKVSQPYIERQRRLLSEIRMTSAAAPAMCDLSGENEYVFIRGNPKKPGDIVPRRFLEVFGGEQMLTSAGYRDFDLYDCDGPDGAGLSGFSAMVEESGRLQLAEWMVDPEKTPILPRVIVNRIWQHYFGKGLVPTPDDFGTMGQDPSHPELLDWLAGELVTHDWSLKHIHRLIQQSSAYRMSSEVDGGSLMAGADAESPIQSQSNDPQLSTLNSQLADPQNRLLHRMNVKRLEGEIIRDALLAVSGRLDERLYGKSTPVHLTTFLEGRGRPDESGPVDGEGRRSLYIAVRRNFAEPFFQAFDMPNPHSTIGRRSVSNVPAQALALMNNPLVIEQAGRWAARLDVEAAGESDDERIALLYQTAFGRSPTADEVDSGRAFLRQQSAEYRVSAPDQRVWADYCHVLVNTKEFVFIR